MLTCKDVDGSVCCKTCHDEHEHGEPLIPLLNPPALVCCEKATVLNRRVRAKGEPVVEENSKASVGKEG